MLLWCVEYDDVIIVLVRHGGVNRHICRVSFLQHFRPPRAEFGPNAAMVTKLLSSYHVDVGDVLIKYPDLFTHSRESVCVVVCGTRVHVSLGVTVMSIIFTGSIHEQ